MALNPNPPNVGLNPNIVTDALKSASSDKYRQEALAMQKASHAANMDFTKMKKDEAEWGFTKNQWLNNAYTDSMTGGNAFLQPDGTLNFEALNSKITPEKVANDFKGLGGNRFANIVELQQGASAINSMNTMQKAREVLAHYENQIAQGKSEGEASKPFRNDTFRNWYYNNKTNPDPKVQQMMAMIPFKDKTKGSWGMIGKLFGIGQDDEEATTSFVPGAVGAGGAYFTGQKISAAEDVLKTANTKYTTVKADWTAAESAKAKFMKDNAKYFKGPADKYGNRALREMPKNIKSESVKNAWAAIKEKSADIQKRAGILAKDVEGAAASKIKERGNQPGKLLKNSHYMLKGLALIHGGRAVGEALGGDVGAEVGGIAGTAILSKDFWKWAGGKLAKKLGSKAPLLAGLAAADGPVPVMDAIALVMGAGLSMWEIKSLIDEYQGK